MKIYFQLVGGAGGDMLLSSLIDLGCPLAYLKKEWDKLGLDYQVRLKTLKGPYHIKARKLEFSGPSLGDYPKIIRRLKQSGLDPDVKRFSLETYERIAAAERKVHKSKHAHFHHLAEVDSILEISGFFIALKYFKIDYQDCRVSSFPLAKPSPAILELLKNKKVKLADFSWETVTPTAAALLCGLEQIDSGFEYEKSGRGWGEAGKQDYLIAYLAGDDFNQDQIIKIEVNIDDMNPQGFEPLIDRLYQAGAKEVYLEPVVMKKSRPAAVLSILCRQEDFKEIRAVIFKNTTTFGLRYQTWQRFKLKDKFVYKNTFLGKVKFRVSVDRDFSREIPEYEDCKLLAQKNNLSILDVWKKIV
jgi:uncharacterized protein (DUF111 family)